MLVRAAGLTRCEGIGLYRVAVLEHQHKLVAAAVEAILRRARRTALSPDDDVFKRKPHFTACRDQRVEVPPIHEHEQDGSVLRVFLAALQESREKGDELVFGQFARCRRGVRLAADRAIALDRNVARRIGEDDIRLLSLEQKLVAGRVTCIATQQAVRPQDPQIARPRNGRALQAVRRKFVLGTGLLCLVFHCLVQHVVDLAERKPGQFDVVKLQFEQPLQFARQQIAVPPRQFSQPIISDDVGAPLGRGEIGQTNRRNLLQAEHLCGFDPAVTGDDLEVVGDEDGIDEAKPLDRPRNLFQLLLGMGAGIVRGGTQALGRKVCDLKIRCRAGRRPLTAPGILPTL